MGVTISSGRNRHMATVRSHNKGRNRPMWGRRGLSQNNSERWVRMQFIIVGSWASESCNIINYIGPSPRSVTLCQNHL